MKNKKLFFSVLVVYLIIAISINITSSAAVYGDMDGDGKVRIADARIVLRAAVSINPLQKASDEWGVFGDFNNDGKVRILDARILLRAAVDIEPLAEPATAKPTTTEPTTAKPTTTEPTTAKPTTTEPTTTEPTTAEPTTAEPTTIPHPVSKEEIVELYNNAMNKTKTYNGRIMVDKNEGTLTIINTVSIGLIKNIAQSMMPNDYPTNKKDSFVNGESENGTGVSLAQFTPLEDGSLSTLTAAGVDTAVCERTQTAYKISLKLIEESGEGLNYKPPHHSSCMDILIMSEEDLKPFTLNSAKFDYHGATITAVINENGTLDSFSLSEPVTIDGTLSYGILNLVTMNMTGTWKQDIQFTYPSA